MYLTSATSSVKVPYTDADGTVDNSGFVTYTVANNVQALDL